MALIDTITGAGFVGEPWGYEDANDASEIRIIGAYGHANPGRVLQDVEVYNSAELEGDDIYVALTLTDAVNDNGMRWRVKPGKSMFLAGPVAQLVMRVDPNAGGTVPWGVRALKTGRALPDVAGGHPGHGEHAVRVVAVQNDEVEVVVKTPRPVLYDTFVAYARSKPTSVAGDVLLDIEAGGASLLEAPFDVEGMTNEVLTGIGEAAPEYLSLDTGEDVTITVTSDHADMVEGDLAIGLRYTPQ